MRKLFLIVVFANTFICESKCQPDSFKLTSRVEILTKQLYLQNQQIVNFKKTTDSLQLQIKQLTDDKKKFDLASIIPWILTGITILISALVYKREVSFKNISFVTESNKMKITDPTLWAFYDTYKQDYSSEILLKESSAFQINGTEEFEVKNHGKLRMHGSVKLSINGGTSRLLTGDTEVSIEQNDKVKLEGTATIELGGGAILNSFELVFNYNKLTGTSNKVWEDYMINSITDSTSFYEIVKKESVGYLYAKEYQEKLKEFMAIAQLCKSAESDENKQKIIGSKSRLILAIRSGLIKQDDNFSSLQKYLN